MTQSRAPVHVLFAEQGASWWWVAAGPAAALAMLFIQMSAATAFSG